MTVRGWPEELTPSLLSAAAGPPMDIVFAGRGDDVRAEVEKAPRPAHSLWRARVVGGRGWRVPTLLPWSYGTSENTAFDAALALWVSLDQPGLQEATVALWSTLRMPKPRLVVASRSSQANATIVTARPGAGVEEHHVRETVATTVRVLASALDRGLPTLTLTDDVGSARSVAVSAVIEVRGPRVRRSSKDEQVVDEVLQPACDRRGFRTPR